MDCDGQILCRSVARDWCGNARWKQNGHYKANKSPGGLTTAIWDRNDNMEWYVKDEFSHFILGKKDVKGPYWNMLLNGFWMVSCWNHSKCGLHLGWSTTLLFVSNPVHWIKSEDDSVLGALLQGWIEATKSPGTTKTSRGWRSVVVFGWPVLMLRGTMDLEDGEPWGWNTPEKRTETQKETIVLQPSMFRGYIGFRECVTRQNDAPHYCILIVVSLYCEFLDGSSGFSFVWE